MWKWLGGYVSTSVNLPRGRERHAMAMDPVQGLIFVFGGQLKTSGNQLPESHLLNDLWVWNPESAVWRWLSGTNSTDHLGNYGTKNVSDSANIPGARRAHTLSFYAPKYQLILFGGSDVDQMGRFEVST